MTADVRPGARALQAAAAIAPALASPREPLPRRRTSANDPQGTFTRRVLPLALSLLALLLALPLTAPGTAAVVLFAVMAATCVGAVWGLVSPALRRPGNLAAVWTAALLAAVLVALWVGADTVARRVLLSMPWLGIALLLRHGAGERLPRALLWCAALLTLAAALLWLVLLLTIVHRPAGGSQWNVFAGWPWPHYIGAVRGNTPFVRDAYALAADYAVMLGVAAVVLWRRPQRWLVLWAPRFAAALALLHLVGGYRLAFATDG